MKNPGGSSVALIAAVALFATIVAPRAQSAPPAPATLLTLVNATRAQHGLAPLRRSSTLDHSAALKATDIRRCGVFSHTPCGLTFTRTFQQVGYLRGSVAVGENLYWGTASIGSPAAAVDAWLHSPPHRANLLAPGWRQAGIAVVHAQSLFGVTDVWLFVLQFGRRA